MSKRVTLSDVASRAGVSAKTVSRALNGAPYVSEALRERIERIVEELDYHPNVAAQSLAARRSFLIGLTYERPSPSYVVELQKGAIERLESERYRLVVLPFSDVSQRKDDLARHLQRTGLDAAILAPPAADQRELLDVLERRRIRYARITPHEEVNRGIVATTDERAGARAIADHLLRLGHRRIGIIKGDPSHQASRTRMEGYEQAFSDHGLRVPEDLIAQADFTFQTGHEAAMRLLDRARLPTAILAQNDDMAVAAMAAAREIGLRIPEDISVVGYDDSEVSRTAWPQLTTIHQPVREMVWDATDRLLASLEDSDAGQLHESREHPFRLLVRASTGAPHS
ncbi:MAG: LacI family DNA-binding transcriptional regulator [Erythrobacter sp.]